MTNSTRQNQTRKEFKLSESVNERVEVVVWMVGVDTEFSLELKVLDGKRTCPSICISVSKAMFVTTTTNREIGETR